MLWFVLAFASALIFASQELLMRVLSVRTGSPRLFSVAFNLWGAGFAILLFLLQGGSLSALGRLTLTQYALLAAVIILYGFYERFQFFARRGMDAGTFAIVMRLQTVIGFTGAIVFLREPLTVPKVAGVVLVIIASLLLVYKNPKFRLTSAFGITLLCALFLGITGFLDKPASAALPATLYSFILWCAPIVIVAFPGFTKKEIVKELKIGGWKVALAAVLNVVGYIIYIQALFLAEASRVNPIVATTSILTVLGSIVVLGEHDHLWRKILAGVIAFSGVVLLR